MRRIFAILVFAVLAALPARAQYYTDSIPDLKVDSTLAALGPGGMMPLNVTVTSSKAVKNGLDGYVRRAASRQTYVFRIRIFMGNDQSAMTASKDAEARFRNLYPGVRVSREFENPNFKVTVGSWKTRMDAESALLRLREQFPDAMIIKEKALVK